MKPLLMALIMSITALSAAEGFLEVAQQEEEAFQKEMSVELKKQLLKIYL